VPGVIPAADGQGEDLDRKVTLEGEAPKEGDDDEQDTGASAKVEKHGEEDEFSASGAAGEKLFDDEDDGHSHGEPGSGEEWTDEEDRDIIGQDKEEAEEEREDDIFQEIEREKNGLPPKDSSPPTNPEEAASPAPAPPMLIRLPSLSIFRGDGVSPLPREGATFEDDLSNSDDDEGGFHSLASRSEENVASHFRTYMVAEYSHLLWRQQSSKGEEKFLAAFYSSGAASSTDAFTLAAASSTTPATPSSTPTVDRHHHDGLVTSLSTPLTGESEDRRTVLPDLATSPTQGSGPLGERQREREDTQEDEDESEEESEGWEDNDDFAAARAALAGGEGDQQEYIESLLTHLNLLEKTSINLAQDVEMIRLEYEGLKVRNIRMIDEFAHYPAEIGELRSQLALEAERDEVKEVELATLRRVIEELTQRTFTIEKESEERESGGVRERDQLKAKVTAEAEARALKETRVKQLEGRVAQLEKQVVSDKELREMVKGEKTITESEVVKRLEKKTKRMELEKFEHEMQITQIEANHAEALRKIAVKVKLLETNALTLEYRKLEDASRAKDLEIDALRRQVSAFGEYQTRKNTEMTVGLAAARDRTEKSEQVAAEVTAQVKQLEQAAFETELRVAELESKKKHQLKVLNAKIRDLEKKAAKKAGTVGEQAPEVAVAAPLDPSAAAAKKGRGAVKKAQDADMFPDIFAELDPKLLEEERQKVKGLERELAQLVREISSQAQRAEENHQVLVQQHEQEQHERGLLAQRHDVLEQQRGQLEQDHGQLRQLYEELQQQHGQAQTEEQQLVAAHQKRVGKLEQESGEWQQRHGEEQRAREAMEQQHGLLQGQLQQVQQHLAEAQQAQQQRVEQQGQEAAVLEGGLKANVETLTSERAQLTHEREQLIAQHQTTVAEKDQLQQQLSEAHQKLAQLEEEAGRKREAAGTPTPAVSTAPDVAPSTPKPLHFDLQDIANPGMVTPPGLSPTKRAAKLLVVPGQKMTPLEWSKISQDRLSNTIWDKSIDDDIIRQRIDLKELEILFSQKSSGISNSTPFLRVFFFHSCSYSCCRADRSEHDGR